MSPVPGRIHQTAAAASTSRAPPAPSARCGVGRPVCHRRCRRLAEQRPQRGHQPVQVGREAGVVDRQRIAPGQRLQGLGQLRRVGHRGAVDQQRDHVQALRQRSAHLVPDQVAGSWMRAGWPSRGPSQRGPISTSSTRAPPPPGGSPHRSLAGIDVVDVDEHTVGTELAPQRIADRPGVAGGVVTAVADEDLGVGMVGAGASAQDSAGTVQLRRFGRWPVARGDLAYRPHFSSWKLLAMKLDSSISAVITGGASGLGAATARRLAQHGVKVALFDLNAEAGEKLAAELGGVFCKVDVTKEDEVDAAFAKARAAIGQERILINCAGTGNAIKTAAATRPPARSSRSDGQFRPHHPDQPGRHLPLHRQERGRHADAAGAARRRPRRDRQHRQRRGAGRPDGPGQLLGEQGRHRRHDAADRARPDGRGDPRQHHPAGIFNTPLLQGAPENVKTALAASVPFPKRLGDPDEYAALAEFMVVNGYMNGESVRIDGAIRMAPR